MAAGVGFEVEALVRQTAGQRLGVVCTPAGWVPGTGNLGDYLCRTADVRALLALEHGLRGELQDGVTFDRYVDARSGTTVFSYYGASRTFPHDVLEGLDAVVFHAQDVTHRAYTYKHALADTLSACAATQTRLVVLDRPTPLGFLGMRGPLWEQFFPLALPVLPGLTLGELALYLRKVRVPEADLTVIPVAGWSRADQWSTTGLPWIPPSPNIPTVDSACCYALTGFFQHTTLSEGRGTCKPFEYVGAPYVDAARLAAALSALDLPGILFREVYFQPGFNKYAGEVCGGVHVMVTAPSELAPIRTMLEMAQTVAAHCPEAFDLTPGFARWLDGGQWTRERLRDLDVDGFLEQAEHACADFREHTADCRLYA